MKSEVLFEEYSSIYKKKCLLIFDENCPQYFAPNERSVYETFLDTVKSGYEICIVDNSIVGAFGLVGDDRNNRNLNWILLSPRVQGEGLGKAIMERVIELARQQAILKINIAASHLSKGFFVKHGALIINKTIDGWGPGMHKTDMELSIWNL